MRYRILLEFGDGSSDLQMNPTYSEVESIYYPNVMKVTELPSTGTLAARGYSGFQLSMNRSRPMSDLSGKYRLYDPEKGYPGFIYRYFWNPSLEKWYCLKGPGTAVTHTYISLSVGFYNFPLSTDLTASLVLIFDKVLGEYPQTVEVLNYDETKSLSLTNDRAEMRIPILSLYEALGDETNLRFKFKDWNVPYHTFKMCAVAVERNLTFEEDVLQKYTCSEEASKPENGIKPGLLQQYADFILRDKDNYFRSAISTEIQDSFVFAQLQVWYADQWVILGKYLVDECHKNENDLIDFSCSDPSREFDEISLEMLAPAERNLYDLLEDTFGLLGYTISMAEATAAHCRSIIVKDGWLPAEVASARIQKLCDLGQLNIYWNIDVFRVERCY